jgi:hypothetical protein
VRALSCQHLATAWRFSVGCAVTVVRASSPMSVSASKSEKREPGSHAGQWNPHGSGRSLRVSVILSGSTADTGHDRLHLLPQGEVRGRADLPIITDRPFHPLCDQLHHMEARRGISGPEGLPSKAG